MNPAAEAPERPIPAAARAARAAGRSLLYCAVLIPVATAALIAALVGRRQTAVSWWRALRAWLRGSASTGGTALSRPGTVAVIGHALVSLLLGAAALVPLGIQVLMLLRGVLYGLVDRGPYDHSWGGPTRAGAWLVHVLVGIPFTIAALGALVGVAALHQRLTRSLDGGRLAWWQLPLTVVICLAGAAFVVAWSRQI